ncbi:hypothetical protein DR095_01580 [Mycoplasma flocculare]|nr:hypothetical protein [Mesomycoplasma flocculare]MXR12307.1 hypothetical protein [Mesomycoplasma flocculare]MXR56081.1 hypothetical protein [Mesomycoplasma flocculare]
MGIAELKQLAQIINLIKCKNIKLIFDIDIPNFIDLLEFRPFLIKPNVTELQKILLTLEYQILPELKTRCINCKV